MLTTFPDRGAEPRKQRPYFGDHGTTLPEKHRVSCLRVFSLVTAVANLHSRSAAQNRATFAQRAADNWTSTAQIRCCSGPLSFLSFLCVKSSSRNSLVHILPTSSFKSAPKVNFLKYFLKCKSSSRRSPVHFLSATFPDRGAETWKRRPYFGDHGSQFTRKKHRVSRPKVFSRVLTRGRTVTLSNYLMMDV